MKKVLITGASGFIGTNLYLSLRNKCEVVCLDIKKPKLSEQENKYLQIDLRDEDACKEIFEKTESPIDIIYHLAAQTSSRVSEEDPNSDISINCIGITSIIRYAELLKERQGNYPLIVFTSSMAVYGDAKPPYSFNVEPKPNSIYGLTKLFGESCLERYERKGGRIKILRLYNVYGPYQDMSNNKQGMLSIFLAQGLNAGKYEVTGSLTRTRDFIFIDDVIDIMTNDVVINSSQSRYDVCSGVETSVETLLKHISHSLGIEWNTNLVTNIGSHAGDMDRSFGVEKVISECLSKKPTTLKTGLEKFLRHFNGK